MKLILDIFFIGIVAATLFGIVVMIYKVFL